MKRFLSALLLLPALALAATTTPVQLLSPSGSTAGQAIVSNGPSSAPTWQAVTATALGPIAANTLIGNATGSSAAPTAVPVTSCSTANSALKWTSGSGFSCGTTFALTGSNLSQFASTTSAQLLGVLSDETGSGAAVFGTSPTIGTPTINTPTVSGGTINNASVGATTPSTGAFTTLSATGAITPSQTAGIVGTTTNNNANAGSVGEYVTNAATGVSLTSATTASITSVPLTAGDWDVSGVVTFVPAGTTTTSQIISGISTVNNTLPANNSGGFNLLALSFPAGAAQSFGSQVVRVSLASPTTVYLVGQATFAVSTMTANGFIRARRVR